MNHMQTDRPHAQNGPAKTGKTGWLAVGGTAGAILSSVCCIAPLIFLTLGISGAWIGTLTSLEPYKPYFAGVALIFIAFGFREVYFKSAPACPSELHCPQRKSMRFVKIALWSASALVLLALTIDWWAPLFY